MQRSACGNGFQALAGFACAALLAAAPLAVAAGDSWSPTSTSGSPQGRSYLPAVWTGSKMIVWGGFAGGGSDSVNTGGAYDPATNTWSSLTTVNAPADRDDHTAVWTGSRMIVFGGDSYQQAKVYDDGFAYDPATNSWTSISNINAPSARYYHSAVWTGSKMIVWGGWTKEPSALVGAAVEFTQDRGAVNTGAIYDPQTGIWSTMSTVNAPAPRGVHTAVWTGSKMIVWGGSDGSSNVLNLNIGGIYDPQTDSWTATSALNAPSARDNHSAVWTGSRMIIWGGYNNSTHTNTGGVFDPETNTWTPTTLTGAPSSRSLHVGVWTGSRMVIWGGYTFSTHDVYFGNGALYDPVTNSWSPMTSTGAPSPRLFPSAVWTGAKMIAWSGYDGNIYVSTGAVYTPPAVACPPDGARRCVTPVSPGADAHSAGRSHPI